MGRDFSRVSRGLNRAAGEKRDGDAAPPNHAAQHIRSIQSQVDAIGRGDYAAALEHAHSDVELDIFAPPEFLWIRKARGPQELQRALEHNFGSVEDQQPEIVNVVAQGDVVVLIGRETGRIRESGAAYAVEFVHRFMFRDQRLAAVRVIVAKAV